VAVIGQVIGFVPDHGLDFVILDKEVDSGGPHGHVLTDGEFMLDLLKSFVEAGLALFNDLL